MVGGRYVPSGTTTPCAHTDDTAVRAEDEARRKVARDREEARRVHLEELESRGRASTSRAGMGFGRRAKEGYRAPANMWTCGGAEEPALGGF